MSGVTKRIAVITTHPIQYYAPLFKESRAMRPSSPCFYTWEPQAARSSIPASERSGWIFHA